MLAYVPSFQAACVASVCVLAGFVVWILVDASFNLAIDVALMDLRIRHSSGLDLRPAHQGSELGSRLLLFGILALLAISCTTIVGIRLFAGDPAERTIRAMLLATALASGWLGLLVGYDKLSYGAFQLRLWWQLPQFEVAAAKLAIEWPDGDGTLPFFGAYTYDVQYPNFLMVDSAYEGYPLRETLGAFIRRTPEGSIQFDLASGSDRRLEFYPQGGEPKSHADVFDDLAFHYRLENKVRFGESIYLTTYSQSSDLVDESESPESIVNE